MFKQWREKLPEDSIFRKPLVFEITLVLVIKIILLVVLWQVAFKPLKPAKLPNIDSQILSSTSKEISHD